eukprot:TRINITY_DN29854_c0_g2_i1.p1 TRINITY_DN29854_c0_g2~~TRINITY_DN29854_c0_g2_i1.p1  ORF type:complete len:268 (+),score=37.37 TRINITY_DN29854_c0_g2_i1:105-908(+)
MPQVLSEAAFAGTLQKACSTSALPALSRSLSSLCKPRGSSFQPKGTPGCRVEWVGGAQRWRFREAQSPGDSRQLREAVAARQGAGSRVGVKAPGCCSQALHPVTAARWDAQAKNEADQVLKKLGYFPGQPRQRGRGSESRLSDFLPSDYRAFSGGSVLPVRESTTGKSEPQEQEPKGSGGVEKENTKQKTVGLESRCGLESGRGEVRVLHWGAPGERLIVKRWRQGHAETVLPRVVTDESRGAQPTLWQDGLRKSVFDSLVTFGSAS